MFQHYGDDFVLAEIVVVLDRHIQLVGVEPFDVHRGAFQTRFVPTVFQLLVVDPFHKLFTYVVARQLDITNLTASTTPVPRYMLSISAFRVIAGFKFHVLDAGHSRCCIEYFALATKPSKVPSPTGAPQTLLR